MFTFSHVTYSNVAFSAHSMHIAYQERMVSALISIGYLLEKIKNSFMWEISKFRENYYRNEKWYTMMPCYIKLAEDIFEIHHTTIPHHNIYIYDTYTCGNSVIDSKIKGNNLCLLWLHGIAASPQKYITFSKG